MTENQGDSAPMWTRDSAEAFIASIHGNLDKMGVSAQIVGSVSSAGQSAKDLDVVLIPKPGVVMTTAMALQAIEDHLMKDISDDRNTNPVDTIWPEEAWFATLWLRDGRLVEFYLPERLFPNVESLADLPSGFVKAFGQNDCKDSWDVEGAKLRLRFENEPEPAAKPEAPRMRP